MHPELTLSRAIRQTHSKASRADVTITECRTIPLDNSPGQFPLPFWVGHFPQTIPPIYYAYIHIHVCIYIHIHTYIHTYIYTHTYTHIHALIHIHTYIYMHTYTYIYKHTYIYICMYVCEYSMYVCIHICIIM